MSACSVSFVRVKAGARLREAESVSPEKAVFALEETSWNELETTKILLLLHLQVSAQTKITVLV